MPKFKFDSEGNFADVDAAVPFDNYDGPVPPKGVYKFRIKRPQLVINSKDNEMITFIAEIAEPKGSDKAKYNGAVSFENITPSAKSAQFVNAFLDSIGANRNKFWGDGGVVTEDDELPTGIKRIAGKVFEGLTFHAQTKIDRYRPEEPRMKIGAFLAPVSAAAEAEDEEPDEDAPEAPVADQSGQQRARKRPAKPVNPVDVDDEGDEGADSDDPDF